MAKQKTANDKAWEKLFDEFDIVKRVNEEGIFIITAAQINKVREARLMTKFDHSINLPSIFKEHNLSILSNSNSSYVIGRFRCYEELPDFDDYEIQDKTLPPELESIDPSNLYSESSALLCAQYAGIINDVLEEEVALTVFGRMRTGNFEFSISSQELLNIQKIDVQNAQIEIDGGFEGETSFAIIEAKNNDVFRDFHIRQLYYPYRLWLNKIGQTKSIIPILCTYSNEIFSFYVYEFTDSNNFNSLKLVRKKRYRIVPMDIEISHIRKILKEVSIVPEPKAPFPQADTFERVINLLKELNEKGSLNREEITTNYAFDIRQTGYYTSAARYLELLDSKKGNYYLTDRGRQLMKKDPRSRNLDLVKLILSRQVFNQALRHYLDIQKPTLEEIVKFIEDADVNIAGETKRRRSQSVKGWINWILKLTVE